MAMAAADAVVSGWFLSRYGAGEVMRKIYDPGTGHAAQIAELEATRARLCEDRQAGLYDDALASGHDQQHTNLAGKTAKLPAAPQPR
jgi:hypothetical protein